MGKWITSIGCYGIFAVLTTISVSMPTSPSDKMSVGQIMDYFKKGQYIGEKNPDPEISAITDPEQQLTSATKTWQRMWGYPETGELTAEQVEIMSEPRCSNADVVKTEDMKKRKKRFAAFSKWDHTDITYRISVYPRDIYELSVAEIDDAIQRAFNVWARITPLTFRKLARNAKVDIDIQFGSYTHGDYYPFDGPNGYLAHAFFPSMGDTHFDDSEIWTLTSEHYNLFIVATHEFGHALGLGHSTMVPNAIMYPNYKYREHLQLDYDDILGIQTLYGSIPYDPQWPADRPDIEPTTKSTGVATKKPGQPDGPKPTIPPYSPHLPKVCDKPKLDAITYVEDPDNPKESGTFGFQGQYYFKIGDYGYVDEAYPRLIREDWPGIPDNIDAALYWERNPMRNDMPAMSLIFKGNQYWAVQGKKIMDGYPKSVSNLGIPGDLDAAFVWNYNGKTYFFKDFYFYRYTRGVGPDSGFPRYLSSNWAGVPNDVDAAFKWDNMQTYFFKDNKYWRYDDNKGTMAEGYPRQFDAVWLKCSRVNDDRGIYNEVDDTGIAGDKDAARGHGQQYLASISLILSIVIISISYIVLL